MENRFDTFLPRFWASLIDALILLPPAFLLELLLAPHHPMFSLCLQLILTINHLAYYIYFHGKYGQTVGKAIMGIKVIDATEKRKISFVQAFIRELPSLVIDLLYFIALLGLASDPENFVKLPSLDYTRIHGQSAVLWVLLELMTMTLNPRRRALHDYLADTTVVRTDDQLLLHKIRNLIRFSK